MKWLRKFLYKNKISYNSYNYISSDTSRYHNVLAITMMGDTILTSLGSMDVKICLIKF